MRIRRLIPTVLAGALTLLVFSAAPAIAAPQTPVTGKATAITGDSAILEGELNPDGSGEPGAAYYFAYKPSTEACRPGAEFQEVPALGNEKEKVKVEVTNLEPGQTYEFCLLEIGEGEAQGASVPFTTLPVAKPYIASTYAEGVTPFSATLHAGIDPEKLETTYSFEYATNEAMTGAKIIPGGKSIPAGYGEQAFSVETGRVLTPGTTYYFRAVGVNISGTTDGPIEHLTTLAAEPPVVDSETVVLGTRLQATINPNYQETSYSFEYATNEELTENLKVVPGAPPASDLPGVFEELSTVPAVLSGLEPGRTYYYRVVATNAAGTTDGPAEPFRAQGVPAVTAEAAGALTRTTAAISGSIVPDAPISEPTTYHFAYVPQAEYEAGAANPYAHGKSTYETRLPPKAGFAANAVAANLEELAPGTTYDYALVASNELGTTVGPNQTFTTAPPTPPIVATGAAEGVSQQSASITGTVDTAGLQTTIELEFGTTPGAGMLLPATVISSSGTVDAVGVSFNGELQPGTTYYYRVIATNQDGTSYGALLSFTTPGFPAVFPSASLAPVIPYTPIAQLNAKEAKEGKAVNPGKKKGHGKKKRRKSKAHGRRTKPKKGKK